MSRIPHKSGIVTQLKPEASLVYYRTRDGSTYPPGEESIEIAKVLYDEVPGGPRPGDRIDVYDDGEVVITPVR